MRLNYAYAAVWCVIALGLVVLNRRFWTVKADSSEQPPARILSDPVPSRR